MAKAKTRKLSVVTVSMLIVVTTFGLANVIDNLVELGLAAIPSWIAVGFIYFVPMALILAERCSVGCRFAFRWPSQISTSSRPRPRYCPRSVSPSASLRPT